MLSYDKCSLCPRECNINRSKQLGYCKCTDKVKIARAALHFWEEPCISGKKGSGAVFFSGCNLRCCFCQNKEISNDGFGKEISATRLSEIFLELQDKGANNINLVTPAQFVPSIITALDKVKHKLNIPIVYNCGGYEKIETIKELKNYVEIFLPDLKYFSNDLSIKYSSAENYFETATKAIVQMISQVGSPNIAPDGLMKSGVIIRHLVLPEHRKDSIKILEWLSQNFNKNNFLISLMSQYTPPHTFCSYSNLNRRITSYEYNSVLNKLNELGFKNGFTQQRSSAKEEYTPDFNLEGV